MAQPRVRVSPGGEPSAPLVRAQLDRILASDLFVRSERLSAFLTFIVEQTLKGQGDGLKEQVLAIELYGKGPAFNTAADPIVRVDARRLRDKLREYYVSAPTDPVRISIPKGSYTPVFEANVLPSVVNHPGTPVSSGMGEGARPSSRAFAGLRGWWIVAAFVVIVVGVWTAPRWRAGRETEAPLRVLTVTSLPGAEGMPSLSPDGNFVAYTATGPEPTNTADLWVKAVDGDASQQLTDTPLAHEANPSWSPDGRYIAFHRQEKTINRGVFLISPLGGAERRVSDTGAAPSWTPDSRALVLSVPTTSGIAVFEQVIETGARRQVTTPPAGFRDHAAKVSPDGKWLAFARSSTRLLGQSALFVAPRGASEARRLTDWAGGVGGLEWTPDGREILYPQMVTSGVRVFRLAADGATAPRDVPGIPIGTNMLSVSQPRAGGTFRVAFSHGQSDLGLRLVDLSTAGAAGVFSVVVPFCPATRFDVPGRFSPDGTHVAFTSDRSGSWQVWVSERSGAGLRSLSPLQGPGLNVGSWSPDGRSLAVEATRDGRSAIYLVRTEDGSSEPLTDRSGTETDADWSRDGTWVYYASDRSGRSEIWRVPSRGGTPVQVTTDGAFEPREAPDGRTLYYVDAPRTNGLRSGANLRRIPVEGGSSSLVLTGVPPGGWDMTDDGVVFLAGTPGPLNAAAAPDGLQMYSSSDGRVRRLGELPFRIARFGVPRLLSISRDGRWALVSHIDDWQRDILVVDNFR